MKPAEAEAYLRTRALAVDLAVQEVGRRDDAAFVRVASLSDPSRWAVVVTPGDRWFALEVPGGFSLDRFDEDLNDDEVRDLLDEFLMVAMSYVGEGARETRVGRLRLPALVVSTPKGERVLRRSVLADLRGLIPWGDRP